MFDLFMQSVWCLLNLLQPGVRAVLHLVLQSRQTQPLVDTKRLRPRLMVLKFLIYFCRSFQNRLLQLNLQKKDQKSQIHARVCTW